MPLNPNALVTLAEAKSFLKESASTNDLEIERRINSLTATFENELDRKIKQQTLTDYRIDGTGKYYALLPFVPVQSVTKVEIRYQQTELVYKTITDPAKFTVKDKDLGLLELVEDVFSAGTKNILITMSVGYLTTDLEYPLLQSLLLVQLKFDFKKWDQNEIGVSSRSLQDGNIQFIPTGRLLREVQEGLMTLRDNRFV
jgi:hypothetical protein